MDGRITFLPPGLAPERVVACFGLIADTHVPETCRELPAVALDVLRGTDLILHAGDVGDLSVLDALGALAPVVAVHGNHESPETVRELPNQQLVSAGGQRILLWHSHFPDPVDELAWRRRTRTKGDALDRYATRGQRVGADILVFGHTHVPMAYRHQGVLLLNPGAIGPPAPVYGQLIRTVALLYLRDDGFPTVVHVDLAEPTRPFAPPWWTEHDWLGEGSRALIDRFLGSIVAPEFVDDNGRIWERLQDEDVDLRAAYHAAMLREAHRCWSGDIPRVTRGGVIWQLEADTRVPVALRATLISWLRPEEAAL